MRGRTLSPVAGSICLDEASYVQINIYGTNLKQLRERGVDIKRFVGNLGCRSVIMDVPILMAESSASAAEKKVDSTSSATNEECAASTCPMRNYGGSLKTSTPNSTCFVQQPNADEIFQDCIQEYENSEDFQQSQAACQSSVKSRASSVLIKRSEEPSLPSVTKECARGVNTEEPFSGTQQAGSTLAGDEIANSVEDNQSVTEQYSLITSNAPANLHMLTDGSVDESDVPRNNASVTAETPNRKIRKRSHHSPSKTTHQSDVDKIHVGDEDFILCAKDGCTQLSNSQRIFSCEYPNCTAKLCWRPRYGKNRLVDHVRVHWGKKMKKCCFCDYVGTHHRKVVDHLNRFHKESKNAAVLSLESDEDMKELLNLWKQCFPELNGTVTWQHSITFS